MKKCQDCFVRYCSTECCKADWRDGGHKELCKSMKMWLETHQSNPSRKSKKYARLLHLKVKPGMGFTFVTEAVYATLLQSIREL